MRFPSKQQNHCGEGRHVGSRVCWPWRPPGPSTSGSAGRRLPSRGVFYQATFTEFKTKPKHFNFNFKIQNTKKKKDDFASKNDKFTKTHKSGVFLRTRAQWRAQQRSDFTAEASLPRAPPCSTEMENPLQRLVLKKNKYLREYKAQIGFRVHCT